MRVLVIGGSGYVATRVLPLMAHRFEFRVFDQKPPVWAEGESGRGGAEMQNPELTVPGLTHNSPSRQSDKVSPSPTLPLSPSFVQGSVTDPAALLAAAEGMDALLYMAMGKWEADIDNVPAAYDVNVKGVHLALDAAVKAGIKRAVYTSSLSVYDGQLDIRSGATDSEEVYPRSTHIYGFTKWLGEEVCAYFHRTHDLPILALRLFRPVSPEEWRAGHPDLQPLTLNTQHSTLRSQPYCHTSAPDLARALTAALELDHSGFEVIHVTGDTTGRAYRHEKAKRLLNWEPLEGK